MSGPVLPRPSELAKIILWDLPAAALKPVWWRLTGRWKRCPYDAEKSKCEYAHGGKCKAPMDVACPK